MNRPTILFFILLLVLPLVNAQMVCTSYNGGTCSATTNYNLYNYSAGCADDGTPLRYSFVNTTEFPQVNDAQSGSIQRSQCEINYTTNANGWVGTLSPAVLSAGIACDFQIIKYGAGTSAMFGGLADSSCDYSVDYNCNNDPHYGYGSSMEFEISGTGINLQTKSFGAVGVIQNMTIIMNSSTIASIALNGSKYNGSVTSGGFGASVGFSAHTVDFSGAGGQKLGLKRVYCYPKSGAPQTSSPPAGPNLTVTAADLYDASSINSFSVIVFGQGQNYNMTTTNGTVLLVNLTENRNYNLTFYSSNYFPQYYYDVNVTGQSFVGRLYQSVAYFNASEIITGIPITNFWANAPLQINKSNSTGWAKLYLKAGNYNISGNATGYLNSTLPITTTALGTSYNTLIFGKKILRIEAKDIFTNASVSTFNISLTGINVTYSSQSQTSNGNISFTIVDGIYNATFESPTHAWYSQIVTTSSTQFQNETFRVYPINSIFVSIYDIATNLLLQPNQILGQFISNTYVFNQSTIVGTILASSITPEDYMLRLSTTGYTTRDYFFTLSSGSNIILNAYLQNTSALASITFTINDERTSDPIENALISVSRRQNTTWVTIAQQYTDIVGQAAFQLSQSEEYRFTIMRSGYDTRVFDLTPTNTAYTIYLSPEAEVDFSTIYNLVDFLTLPTSNFITSIVVTNFSIITAARSGASINYFGLYTWIQGNYFITNVTGSLGGGTASLPVNLSAFNVSTIDVIYFIGVDELAPFSLNRTFSYAPSDGYGNNTVDDALVFINQNTSIIVQSILAIVIILIVMVSFRSAGATGRAMSFVAGATAAMLGYYDIIDSTLSIILVIILTATFLIYRRDDT